MSCTLEELHQAHYEMLCAFDGFCKKHSLNYVLHGGTLLGAVRHSGFIPWDDDIDVIMDIRSFIKFAELIEKDPIEGMFFQWITTEDNYPLFFAKLRKNNTRMVDPFFENLDVNHGVWMDIFVYLDKPDSKIGILSQEFILKLFSNLCHLFIYNKKVDYSNDSVITNIKVFFINILRKIPKRFIHLTRIRLFKLISKFGKKGSEYVRDYDYNGKHNFCEPRNCFEPSILHKFKESEFYIPQNYDQLLRIIYGDDYMTPIVTHSHVDLENIQL